MTQPLIVITGEPAWLADLQDLSEDYQLHQQVEPEDYMNTLIDHRAALVLVDGDSPEPTRWISPPKVSPATRRIPIVLVSDAAEMRETALLHGADDTIGIAELTKNPRMMVERYARLPDAARDAQLQDDCQQPLPDLAREGIRMFNAGEFYKQHDLFEEQWVETEGAIRDLYRAILQVGVAYYQIERGNYRGALKMLQRSVQWLLVLPDRCQGVDVAQLREDSAKVRSELERLGEDRLHEFDKSLLKPVIWDESS